MIKDILERNAVYSEQLEIELLRHFETLRNEMLESIRRNVGIAILFDSRKRFDTWTGVDAKEFLDSIFNSTSMPIE